MTSHTQKLAFAHRKAILRTVSAADPATSRDSATLAPALMHGCDATARILRARGLEPCLVHADLRIGVLAGLQDNIVVWHQLRRLGIGRGQIARRVERGLLRALHVGVYLWAMDEPTFPGRVRAAVLASGSGAVASHDAALALHGIRPPQGGHIDVTVVGRQPRGRGIQGHEVVRLHRADLHVLRGIPVSAPARALLEVAPRLSPLDLADAVERAQIKRLVTKAALQSAIARSPRRPGVAALRRIAADPVFTRSRAERMLVTLLREAKLPAPVFNAIAEGWEVDALWRHERVVLEFDCYAFHATRSAFERDRRKSADLARARYTVPRTTWTEVTRQLPLVARVAEALAR